MLYNVIHEYYTMLPEQGGPKKIHFSNRVAAVAAAFIQTDGNADYATEFLPDTADFRRFREALNAAKVLFYQHGSFRPEELQFIASAARLKNNNPVTPAVLLEVLQHLVAALSLQVDGLDQYNSLQGFNGWPGRLMTDLLEGYVECGRTALAEVR